MNLLIQSTQEFENDLEVLSHTDKALLVEKMNQYFHCISNKNESLLKMGLLNQLKEIKLPNDYDSSLYALRLEPEIIAIRTLDEDPIFERTIITLFRIVKSSEALEAYSSVAHFIYKHLILTKKEVEAILVG
ncbi:MAG: hypothetical protein SAK29_11900 [Scytonema sp. PMC 1069.18]|nr:hypothetical protein [Scytonema sp. PMC 1069.18]MEC4883287.1 hypothetical protein [Scytonema sp. PMC 1070.18]